MNDHTDTANIVPDPVPPFANLYADLIYVSGEATEDELMAADSAADSAAYRAEREWQARLLADTLGLVYDAVAVPS